jgi:hypothetical protein
MTLDPHMRRLIVVIGLLLQGPCLFGAAGSGSISGCVGDANGRSKSKVKVFAQLPSRKRGSEYNHGTAQAETWGFAAPIATTVNSI